MMRRDRFALRGSMRPEGAAAARKKLFQRCDRIVAVPTICFTVNP